MPSCFVKGCPNSTGYKPEHVHMFSFPRQRDWTTTWLTALGVPSEEIPNLSHDIWKDRNSNYFRLYSDHFKTTDYSAVGHSSKQVYGRVRLNQTAVPNLQQLPQSEIQITKTSIETQTDFNLCCEHKRKCLRECIGVECTLNKQDAGIQWPEFEFNFEGSISKVERDHTYVMHRPLIDHQMSTPVRAPLQQPFASMSVSPITSETSSESFVRDFEMEPIIEEESEVEETLEQIIEQAQAEKESEVIELCLKSVTSANNTDISFKTVDNTKLDPDYMESSTPLSDSFCERRNVSNVVDDELETMVSEKKYSVFHSALIKLLSMVKCETVIGDGKCGKAMVNFDKYEFGSYLKITASCFDNHRPIKWSSQSLFRRISAGNLQLGSAMLFSVMNFDKFAMFAGFLGLQVIAKPTFYRYQRSYLFPTINTFWENEQQTIFSDLKDTPVRLAGDGQCDSPGHNAKYMIYSMQDQSTGKIVSSEVVQKTECSSSFAMEKHAFIKSVDKLLARGVKIDMISTDRHVGIAKAMRTKYQFIRHQYDVWHLSKSVKKKISLASKKKNCSQLGGWTQSVGNHLWWCSRTCEGSLELLKEKWMSILHHVKNKHRWDSNILYHKCPHARIPRRLQRTKKWLKTASPEHNKFEKIVGDKRLLKDLAGVTHFTHTGDLEVFHGMVLKYRKKYDSYSIDGMDARTRLAILANNANVGRQQARVKTDAEVTKLKGELRYRTVFSKLKKAWVLKPIFEEMDYSHVFDMMVTVLEMRKYGIVTRWKPRASDFPKNIATCSPPEKSDLIARHISRFAC